MEEKILNTLKKVLDDINMDDKMALELITNDDTNLIEAFSLDSFLRVQFVVELEEMFNIEIDMEEIDAVTFEKSKNLKQLIQEIINGDD